MSRIIMVLGDRFSSRELLLKSLLERKGHNVRLAGKTRTAEAAKDGGKVTPDTAFYEINPDYFDFVIVIGENVEGIARPELVTLIRKCVFEKKGAAGITGGAVLLAFAGVLNGRRATVAPSEKSIRFIKDSEARYVAEAVVVDGNIVTAANAERAEEIAAAIAELL